MCDRGHERQRLASASDAAQPDAYADGDGPLAPGDDALKGLRYAPNKQPRHRQFNWALE